MKTRQANVLVLSQISTTLRHWSRIGWAIEKHFDDIPSKLKPIFQQILEDTKSKKEDLEDHNSNKIQLEEFVLLIA